MLSEKWFVADETYPLVPRGYEIYQKHNIETLSSKVDASGINPPRIDYLPHVDGMLKLRT